MVGQRNQLGSGVRFGWPRIRRCVVDCVISIFDEPYHFWLKDPANMAGERVSTKKLLRTRFGNYSDNPDSFI
jgi:hypothetical protein